MCCYSVIAGRKIASEYLALATFGGVGAIVALSRTGSSKPKAKPNPEPLSASGSKDEEDLSVAVLTLSNKF